VIDIYRIGKNLIIIELLQQQYFITLAAPLSSVQDRVDRQQ